MAFSKKTWKGRQGTGLNKFSIDGDTPVTIINQPDSVTEQGDALSAGNLNDLENRIYSAFEDEATARDDADTALKAAIAKNTAEIENLKQTTGQQEITVSYPDDGNYSSLMPNKVPLSVADYAEVPRFRGKSRAWNQLVPLDVLTTRDFGGFKITNNNNGSWTLNGTASSNIAEYLTGAINLPIGHKILFGYVNLGSEISGLLMRDQYSFAGTGSLTIWESNVATSAFDVIVDSGTVLNNVKIVPIIRDLTLIFGAGNEPSTVAEAVAQIPDLLKYDAYDAGSLVDTTYSGVESVGRNLFEGVLQIGGLDYSTGAETANSELRRSPYIQVKPSTEYYFLLVSGKLGLVHFYDFNKNHIEAREAGSGTLLTTSPASAFYVRFNSNLAIDVSLWDSADLCVNQSDSQNGTYTPYQKNTLSLPSPVTLRSAGSVADELDVESGVITRKVREWNLEDLVWSWIDSYWASGTIKDYIKKPSSNSVNADIVAEKYVVSNWSAGGNMTIAVLTTGLIGIEYADSVNSPTGKIYFALATPTTESLTPIPDNFVKVQAGGTINTIQSQSPVIDNCLDVAYDFIPQ